MAEWKRVEDPFDPRRCQTVHSNMQCPYEAVEGSDRCPRHAGGAPKSPMHPKNQRYNYRLGKWQARVASFATSPVLKSLREEIGVLRILLEETVSKCNDSYELLFASTKITILIDKIQSAVLASQKLDSALGTQLSQTELFAVAEELVQIIIENVPDPKLCAQIADKIGITITRTLEPGVLEAPESGNYASNAEEVLGEDSSEADQAGSSPPLYLGGEVQSDGGTPFGTVETDVLPVVEATT